MKIKISKFKNTGLIFELLSRRIVSEILTEQNSKSLQIIKRYFKSSSELGKEYSLYKLFSENTQKLNGTRLIDLALSEYSKLDEAAIQKQRYNLIKEIKTNYNLDEFFQHKIENYRLNGALCYLFENRNFGNQLEKLKSREIVLEHLNKETEVKPSAKTLFETIDRPTRSLAIKLLFDKFNDKYGNLHESQKQILSQYILTGPDNIEFRKFILSECTKIKKKLLENTTASSRLNIKIKEAASLLDNIIVSKTVKDEHVSALLKYHELIHKIQG